MSLPRSASGAKFEGNGKIFFNCRIVFVLKTFLGHICSSPESYGVTHSYATKSAIRLNITRSTPASMRRKTFMLLQELAEQCSRPKYLIGFIVCHETVAHATI